MQELTVLIISAILLFGLLDFVRTHQELNTPMHKFVKDMRSFGAAFRAAALAVRKFNRAFNAPK